MKDSLGYYNILEVDGLADAQTIKIKYRDLAKHWHPDSNKSENAMEHFQKLSVAYDVLKNEKTRLIYDLLSEIYGSSNFPDMNNLSILKDKFNNENPLVRVVNLQKIVGKIIKYTAEEDKLVCTYDQAKQEVLRYSLSNWFLGWWHPKAFMRNIKAIIGNIKNIGNNNYDNLVLLVHNAIAYHQENKDNQAMLSAIQALNYADEHQQELIKRFLKEINVPVYNKKIPQWRLGALRLYQYIIPFLLLLAISYPFVQHYNMLRYMKKENKITYFQKVKYDSGAEFVDDVVVSKIYQIPIDVNDNSKLYHLTDNTDIMYGPGKKFDVLKKGRKGQTVRVTGFTPDKSWYRIMIDNGEMGFVEKTYLKQGMETEPPYGSKIIPEPL
ncbi:MAG: DnaJ domain-containing protein [Alphaproteobacteria bacterium]|nr:DnaJ domain-containing protein [Alphaproteobacteria bacterium]